MMEAEKDKKSFPSFNVPSEHLCVWVCVLFCVFFVKDVSVNNLGEFYSKYNSTITYHFRANNSVHFRLVGFMLML